MTVEQDARVHHETVTKLSTGELETFQPKKTRKRVPSNELTHLRVVPWFWKEAQRLLADSSYSKITIVSETEVILR